MSKCKRIRAGNYSKDEKEAIVEFIKENSTILESKILEPNVHRRKRKLWEELSERLKKAGYHRSPDKLRDNYFRMKQAAKANITRFKKEQKKTEDGAVPGRVEEPSEIDWAIYNATITGEIEKNDSDPHVPKSPKPLPVTADIKVPSKTGKKRAREMTEFEEEMLRLNKTHIEARIENERLIAEKEIEILNLKYESEQIRVEILKKMHAGSAPIHTDFLFK